MALNKNSDAYRKYIEKYDPSSPKNIQSRKDKARQKRKQWWAENWIGFWGLVVAVIALGVSVIALLK